MENKMIPELRFPEFKGEWVEKKLGEIVETIGGGTPKTTKEEYWNGDILWLTPTEIKEKYISSSQRKLTKLGLQESSAKILPKYSLLFTSRATIGDVGIALKECSTNQGFQSFPPNDNYKTDFLYNWILHNRKLFIRKSSGSTFLEISKSEISKIKITIPSLPEQTKIANFLSAVDKRIDLLQKKKAAMEQYKKGVMQKLFSQSIRFKDDNGNDFPNWEEKKLEEIAKFRRGSFPQPYGLPKWYDDINGMPFVQVYDVDNNFKLKTTTKQKISNIAKEKSVFVKKGTIVLTIQGTIGRIAITQYDAYVDRTLLIFQSFTVPIDKLFFTYVVYLLFAIEKQKAAGGTIKTITKEKLSAFVINLPCIEEQQKIAIFLSAIDKSIEKLGNQIDDTVMFKKGLLQKMFV